MELDEDDVTELFRARGADFHAVVKAADLLRREVCGDAVSYVVTRNINYTNVCYFRCGFCAFSKGKLAENLRGALPRARRRDRAALPGAWDRGAVEVCLQGGIHPGFTGDYYAHVCEAIKRRLPDLHVHAFSALEVWQGAATLGVSLAAYLQRLKHLGLASLPGTAAEILDDEVRRVLCPDKVTTGSGSASTTRRTVSACARRRRSCSGRSRARAAGPAPPRAPRPAEEDRRVHGVRAASVRAHGGADLPEGTRASGPTFREAILMHAVGRLALHPYITNVQASWVKLGIDGAQAALRAGANDLGGTLMNESISRAAGAAHGQEMPPEGWRLRSASSAARHASGRRSMACRIRTAHGCRTGRRPRRAAQPERERRRSEATETSGQARDRRLMSTSGPAQILRRRAGRGG